MPGGRVLMIAHHFPPAGGSGANRAVAMARYLGQYDWTPTVLTVGTSWTANRDDGLLADVPPDVRVVRTRSFESPPAQPQSSLPTLQPSRGGGPEPRWRSAPAAAAFRSHVGHARRFPDAHVGWVPFAFAAALRQRYDVAYSSSGPFSSHLVGLLLKRKTKKPWVAELRDGWYRWNRAIFPDYPAWRDLLERRLEAIALRRADRVVLVTERMAGAFRGQYPDLPRQHFAVVPNGFDAEQFDPPLTDGPKSAFEVVHSGALYYGRSLAAFLAAAENLVEFDEQFERAFSLTLVGTLDQAARAELERSKLGTRVRCTGQVDHASSLAAMRRSDLLLLVANTTPGAEATVPGKLFEYLAIGKPVLAIAPSESSTGDVLEQTGGGYVAQADDVSSIAEALRAAFAAHLSGVPATPDATVVGRFDRRILAGDLARMMDELAAR